MKLNLGCGHDRREGWINVDAFGTCNPDLVFDLETTPWPWETSSVSEVLFNHSLEHMGASTSVFLALMQELHRVCAPDAVVDIRVPHPRHETFIGDPTHVRIISPQILSLFDRQLNEQWKTVGLPTTPLALYLDVDFQITESQTVICEPWAGQFNRGEISPAQVQEALMRYNNVAEAFHIKLRVRK